MDQEPTRKVSSMSELVAASLVADESTPMLSGVRKTPAPPPMSSRALAMEAAKRRTWPLVLGLAVGALVLVAITAVVTVYVVTHR